MVYSHCQGNTCPTKMAGKAHFYSLDPNRSHDGGDLYDADTVIQNWMMKQRRNAPVSFAMRPQLRVVKRAAGRD